MPTLFKPKRVEYTKNGKHRLPSGRRVTAKTKGAIRTVVESAKWYGRYTDGNGRPCRVPLAESKDISRRMLAKLSGDAQLAGVGISDPFAEHRVRPIAEHLEDYRRMKLASGISATHVNESCDRVEAIIEECNVRVIGDLHDTDVAVALAELRQRDTGAPTKRTSGRKGFGVKTSNHYLSAIRTFCKWMVQAKRIPFDPLASLKRLDPAVDVRVERRALSQEHFAQLIEATRSGGPCLDLLGSDRVMVYLLAAYTGLRCGEIAALSPPAFDLGSQPATVTTKAAVRGNKAKKTVRLPLRADLADLLRAYVAGRPRGEVLWPSSWKRQGAKLLRHDMETAGMDFADEDGRVYDFHALRHQFITNLSTSGVSPKVAQDLARHSDIKLTMNAYTHLGLHDLAGAVEKLPPLPGTAPETTERRTNRA